MEKRYSRPKAFSSSTSNILAVMDGDGCKRSRSEVDISRGFIPSDMKDPSKKKILDDLTHKIFLSSNEEKLKKKQQVSVKRSSRPKYFFEKNGSQFVNNTPVKQVEQDIRSQSSKKRNPNQMYTDSSYYHPKHHPSVAEQVKMAHQLSSSLFDDANKKSQGQEMFFKRVKTSDPQNKNKNNLQVHHPSRSTAPNMKLVMNPEGKLHDWTELPKEELSELARFASSHFGQTENIQNGGGNYSSYKDIFESRRNVFANIMDNDLNNNSRHWNRNLNANNSNHNHFHPSSTNHAYHQKSPSKHTKNFFQPHSQSYDLLRSKTSPSIPCPNLPKRGSSKNAMAAYDNRPALEKFFV